MARQRVAGFGLQPFRFWGMHQLHAGPHRLSACFALAALISFPSVLLVRSDPPHALIADDPGWSNAVLNRKTRFTSL